MTFLKLRRAGLVAFVLAVQQAGAQPALDPEITRLAQAEVQPMLETLRRLTSVDSGTTQAAGLGAVADMIESFVKPLGGQVQRLTPAANVPGQNVVVTFKGSGTRNVMLMAHMDTVYPPGVAAARPFRIEGNRAIAPGIADDKGGVANILHAVKVLLARGVQNHGRITMVFNVDEERGSVGSRDLIRRLAAEHDVVFSGEPASAAPEVIVLGTSGAARFGVQVSVPVFGAGSGDKPIEELADTVLRTRDAPAQVPNSRLNWTIVRAEDPNSVTRWAPPDSKVGHITFKITGKASHAGVAPQLGVNAVTEGAMLVQRVTQAATQLPGGSLRWRVWSGGLISNVIPDRGLAVVELAVPAGTDLDSAMQGLQRVGESNEVANARIESEAKSGAAAAASGRGSVQASADMRLPDVPSFSLLDRALRDQALKKKFANSSIEVAEAAMPFPPFNATEEGKKLAEHARTIYRQLGAELVIVPRTFGGTDAAWAGQTGKPVVENMGLPGGNYHSGDEEYVLIDRIAQRVNLLAEMIRSQLEPQAANR